MEITNALWIDPNTILQPWPEEENRLKVTIRPFELPVCLKLTYSIVYMNLNIYFKKRFGFAFFVRPQFLYWQQQPSLNYKEKWSKLSPLLKRLVQQYLLNWNMC